MRNYDVIIIGAGAAGLICAIEAGKRGRKVLLIDHNKKPAEKIRISGGGRCNFTNLHCLPANFISENPHFTLSAFSRFNQHDFIKLIEKHKIQYHEKTLGQLFCNESSKLIINMLLNECNENNVTIELNRNITHLCQIKTGFSIKTADDELSTKSLVIATGGLSIPKMGASDFGYKIAKKFALNIVKPQAALVPFIFHHKILELCQLMSGTAVDIEVCCNKTCFKEAMLFTHRGLSGPAILQISSYWQPGDHIMIKMLPDIDITAFLKLEREKNPKANIQTSLGKILPKKLVLYFSKQYQLNRKLADYGNVKFAEIANLFQNWQLTPDDTEGFKTAEVTKGGIDTNELSSKTFEAKKVKGLYFIGEVIDVTGWLGGYNFQWAWSSGYCAGQFV